MWQQGPVAVGGPVQCLPVASRLAPLAEWLDAQGLMDRGEERRGVRHLIARIQLGIVIAELLLRGGVGTDKPTPEILENEDGHIGLRSMIIMNQEIIKRYSKESQLKCIRGVAE